MSEICVNKLINDLDTGAVYLVLWVAPGNEHGYWYELTSSRHTPTYFSLNDLSTDDSNGRYEMTDYIPKEQRAESVLSDAEIHYRDRIWNMMQSLVEYEPDIYDAKTRGTMTQIVVEEFGISKSSVYSYLDRYWRSGKTKNAFLPSFHKRGGKGVARQTSGKKIGRKATTGQAPGKVITAQDKINFAAAVKKYYLNRNKNTIKDVYEKLLADFYSKPCADKNEQLELFPPSELPSLRQFRYWYSVSRDAITEQKKRDGERAFELTGRSIIGRSDYGLMGPGAQFQIDATVGDIYLVSQFDRSNLIGRPVMYFVVDVFSRMVTGMSVGLEGPSWGGAMTALANMTVDKVTYCKEFGIEIEEQDWPCHHVPASLLGDRGEMESRNADNLVNMLGIRIVNAPPYRADMKGVVEQHFRTINTKTAALLPGSVKPDMARRGGHDYRLDAKLDIRQFTQIIIKCVLHYNKHHYMDYFEKSEAMIREHIEAIPIKLWDFGIQHISGALRSFPEEQVRLAVMPASKGSVTLKGIRFKGLFYSCDRAIRETWFEKARAKNSWQVEVLYDPHNMANIYARSKGDASYELCSLLDWNSKNAGKHLDEIIYEQRSETIRGKQLKIRETEAKVNLNAEIDAMVAEAHKMAKGLPQKNKHERVSQIKEHRREEREFMRTANAGTGTEEKLPADSSEPSQNSQDDNMSPILRMIKRKAEEELQNGR